MPFRRVEITTPLPAHVVGDRLREKVRVSVGFWEALKRDVFPSTDPSPFKGTVSETEFKLTRVIRYRNSFLPVIRGEITPSAGGVTIVRLTMRLSVFAAAFMAVWVGFLVMVVPWQRLLRFEKFGETDLVPLGMLLAGILMTVIGFYPEAWKAERMIRDIVAP